MAFIAACLLQQPSAGRAQPLPFLLTRFDEDYGYLADAAARTEFGDPLKYISLGDSAYLSLGGEIRERIDSFDAPKFGIGAGSDIYDLQRLLLSGDLHVGDHLRAFVQVDRADAIGKRAPYGPSDVDRSDLQNAFVDLKGDARFPLTLRVGRQELLLDSAQRFISVREGPNVRQSFDGARATWSDTHVRIDAFATRPVQYRAGAFDDKPDPSQRLSGVYGRFSYDSGQSLDLYAIELDRNHVTFAGVQGDERRQSFGARWAAAASRVDHDFEAVYQTGRFADQHIRAWAVGLTSGYTWAEAWSPKASLEFDAGSGDRRPGDGRLGTFNPMFPKGAYFDESALTSWANLVLLRASIAIRPVKDLSLSAAVLERWRQTGNDAVYTQPYLPLASTAGNSARRVSEGLQFDAVWRANRYVNVSAQLLHQFAGPAIRQAAGRDVTFAMLIGQLRF